jgi:hypothetical protein
VTFSRHDVRDGASFLECGSLPVFCRFLVMEPWKPNQVFALRGRALCGLGAAVERVLQIVTFSRIAARFSQRRKNEHIMILRIVIGIVAGAALGFAWHKLVGCSTGACPLTANPYISTIYGAILGVLVATSVR